MRLSNRPRISPAARRSAGAYPRPVPTRIHRLRGRAGPRRIEASGIPPPGPAEWENAPRTKRLFFPCVHIDFYRYQYSSTFPLAIASFNVFYQITTKKFEKPDTTKKWTVKSILIWPQYPSYHYPEANI